MVAAIIACFIIGYLAIVFEHPLKLDKTVPALIMAALCWAGISFGVQYYDLDVYDHHGEPVAAAMHTEPAHSASDGNTAHMDGHEATDTHAEHDGATDSTTKNGHEEEDSHGDYPFVPLLLHHIGKVAEILLFLIGAMTIVELIDLHKGFTIITDKITTQRKSKMLWVVSILAFFLSATLDNLASTIVLVSLLRKLVPDRAERIYFVSIAVIAANAGGAWSPIGDVTTTMLWINGDVSTGGLITRLVIPSIVCMLVPVFIASRMPIMRGNITRSGDEPSQEERAAAALKVPGSRTIFFVGIAALIFVPIFKTITHLPPYVGMMLGLGIVWLVSEYLHPDEDFEMKHKYSAHNALSRIEMSSILFFLGILLSVAALESLNILRDLADAMDSAIPNTEMIPGVYGRDLVVMILGAGSALIDNVPLVAASMGMYTDPMDSRLWHFVAYAAGTGGSMLIIGSAAGVAAMGMEKIDFMWYLKNIAWLALVGFLAGAAVFLVMQETLFAAA